MPSWELFDMQDAAYRAETLPSDTLKVSIEAGVTLGWQRYTGNDGLNIGIDSFGASAPAEALYDHFGFSVEAILNKIQAKLKA
jgi:transketolase